MVFKENTLGLTVTVRFQKNEYFKKCEFSYLFFQSISYKKVFVTKKIYFSLKFLKSLVHISNNIAGIVGGPQYYLREEEGDLFPRPIII